jgi:hypothetical protein
MSLPNGLLGGGRLLPSLWLALLPLFVTVPLTLTSSFLIGLPVTAMLRWRKLESEGAHLCAGIVTGLLVPLAILFAARAPAGYWMCIFGAVGGGATAFTWWKIARQRQEKR